MNLQIASHSHKNRSGLTLVEMLISVTLTLLIVFAIVQIFQVLGDTVALGRSTIEMSGELRMLASRVQTDLDNYTCDLQPPNDPDEEGGYFLYEEGPRTDATSIVDGDGNGEWDNIDLTHHGDDDDMLAMTVHSNGKPFKGRVWVTLADGSAISLWIESMNAEVVWWVATLDTNENGLADDFESRMLLRRHFLIVPNIMEQILEQVPGLDLDPTDPIFDPHTTYSAGSLEVPTAAFFSTDVSFRRQYVDNQVANSSRQINSMSDVTTPGNRSLTYYGTTHVDLANTDVRHYSNPLFANVQTGSETVPRPLTGFPKLIAPDDYVAPDSPESIGLDANADPYAGDLGEYSQYIVSQDLLSFDVRIYDAWAPIIQDINNGGTVAIAPGDPAFFDLGVRDIRDVLRDNSVLKVVGRGAFVDLGFMVNRSVYADNMASDSANSNVTIFDHPRGRLTPFSGLPSFQDVAGIPNSFDAQAGVDGDKVWPSLVPVDFNLDGVVDYLPGGIVNPADSTLLEPLIIYDTWSTGFDRDGISQDGNAVPDEGRNGLDDDGQNGVDDAGESESPPPYPVALRGVEVRIRMWDVSTGQVRQVSVVGDFVPN